MQRLRSARGELQLVPALSMRRASTGPSAARIKPGRKHTLTMIQQLFNDVLREALKKTQYNIQYSPADQYFDRLQKISKATGENIDRISAARQAMNLAMNEYAEATEEFVKKVESMKLHVTITR